MTRENELMSLLQGLGLNTWQQLGQANVETLRAAMEDQINRAEEMTVEDDG